MTSVFTPNKGLEEPAYGDYVNDWNAPINGNSDVLDACLGSNVAINVTGVVAGTYNLTDAQIQTATISFTGTLGGNLVFQIAAGRQGSWIVQNAATGAFSISLLVVGGTPAVVQASGSANWWCDATNFHSGTDGATVAVAAVATTSLNVPNAYGALGSYALGVAATGTFTPGQTTAGSNLNIYASGGGGPTTLTGTWRFMGSIASGLAQLWLRTA